jgi:hypothetical protein
MKRLFSVIQNNFGKLLLVGMTIGFMASCDSVLDFDEGDCSYSYKVKFKYDYNMKYTDMFHSLVSTVTLYAFDENGKLAFQNTNSGDQLKANDYAMSLNVDPGKYHLVTWAGLDNKSFAIPVLTLGSSTLSDLTVKTNRTAALSAVGSTGKVGDYVVSDSLFSLWHGEIANTDVVLSRSRDTILTVPLIKNTNTVRIIVCQTATGDAVSKPLSRAISTKSFDFKLSDNNGYMNYDNSLLSDELLTYTPFYENDSTITSAVSSADKSRQVLYQLTGRADVKYNAVVAKISTARLLDSQNPQVSVLNTTTNKEILPTTDLLSYIKAQKDVAGESDAKIKDMSLQEYLDREDTFDIVLYVGPDQTLINPLVIVINNWIINWNNFDL